MAHGIICDFCSAPRPKWRYRCRTFVAFETRDYTIDQSVGDWAACDQCKDMIDRGDFEKLGDHSFEALLYMHPELMFAPDKVRTEMKARLKNLHMQFLLHRLADPPECLL